MGSRMKKVAVAAVIAVALMSIAACVLITGMPDIYEEMVPMRDGVKLYTCGSRPRRNEKLPVIIIRTPYVEEWAASTSRCP